LNVTSAHLLLVSHALTRSVRVVRIVAFVVTVEENVPPHATGPANQIVVGVAAL